MTVNVLPDGVAVVEVVQDGLPNIVEVVNSSTPYTVEVIQDNLPNVVEVFELATSYNVEILQDSLPNTVEVLQSATPDVVEVITAGPLGPVGPQGEVGPPGAAILSGGTNGFIPLWSGSTALESSIIRQTLGTLNISGSANITGSFQLNLNGVDQYFAVTVSGQEKLRVNTQGVLQLATQSISPTAVAGGIFYSSSDAFYLGFNS